MESFEENNMSITQGGTSFSDYNMIFVTHLATLIGTGFTCVGFPLMSATVLSCTFNLLAAASSLLLSILIGWDALTAADYSKRDQINCVIKHSMSSPLLSPSSIRSVINSSDYSKIPIVLSFFEELNMISTLIVNGLTKQSSPDDNDKDSFWIPFLKGVHLIEETLVTPIYFNTNGYRCLAVSLGPMTTNGALSDWKQEICTSTLGKDILSSPKSSSVFVSAKKNQKRLSKWLLEHNLLESQLSIFQDTYWFHFYQDIDISVAKCLLKQTKKILKGEKEIYGEITDEYGTIFVTSRLWQDTEV